MYWHTTNWFSNLSLLFFELFFVLIGDLLNSKKLSTNWRFWSRSSMVAELVEKPKIRSTNGSFRNPFMNKMYQFLLKTFAAQPKWSNSLKNIKNQLRCYGNHHSCYGLRRTLRPVTTKIYDSFLSKNFYRTEINKFEPKLLGLTRVTLILGHPVNKLLNKKFCQCHINNGTSLLLSVISLYQIVSTCISLYQIVLACISLHQLVSYKMNIINPKSIPWYSISTCIGVSAIIEIDCNSIVHCRYNMNIVQYTYSMYNIQCTMYMVHTASIRICFMH